VAAFAVFFPVLAVVGHGVLQRSRHVETLEQRPVHALPDCQQLPNPTLLSRPVSIARWAEHRYLICNYLEVQEVDTQTGEVCTLAPEPRPEVWNPTGLHVRADDHLVLIANYQGHDVLVMRREGERLRAVQRIVHEGMRSPESVAVSDDGRLIGVADYDGNRLWLFRRDGTLAWSRELGMAHGVAFGPTFVVASGLAERTVVKFDLEGNVHVRAGSLGVSAGKYLWPTCVAVHGEHILVSDAHTGHVTYLDGDLNVVDWFGGNGPGAGLFNMPYAVAASSDGLALCDTFKDRLLVLDESHHCRRVVTRKDAPLNWDAAPEEHRVRDGYVNLSVNLPVALPGLPQEVWNPGYERFWLSRRTPVKCVSFPEAGSLFNPSEPPYFCWCTTADGADGPYLLLGHSQGRVLLIVDQHGRCCTQDAGQCLWLVEGTLRTNAGDVFDSVPLVRAAAAAFELHDRCLRDGEDPTEAARRAFWPHQSAEAFRQACARTLTSSAGKAFWRQWLTARTNAERREAAAEFDAAMAAGHDCLPLQELLLRNVLRPRR
jgi:hypothetical protein